jgi:hypothetical protein
VRSRGEKRVKGCMARIVPNHLAFRKRKSFGARGKRPLQLLKSPSHVRRATRGWPFIKQFFEGRSQKFPLPVTTSCWWIGVGTNSNPYHHTTFCTLLLSVQKAWKTPFDAADISV